MPLSDQQIRALLVACHETQSHELNCEEFLMAMAGFAEELPRPGRDHDGRASEAADR